jgi:MSHA biogenesis protein MshL
MKQGNFVLAALPLALTFALAGCAHQPSETIREMNQALGESPAKGTEPPAEVSAALLPPININVTGGKAADTEQRFDVRVRGVPARDFFLGLVDGTPYDIIVPPDLTGSVTLDLKNVTVPEVMETLRRNFGYEYERTKNGFAVLAERLTTRIFYVNYLDVKRAGQSSMAAAPGEVTMTRNSNTNSSSSSSNNNNQGNNYSSTATQGSYSRINTESTSDLWAGLAESIRQVLGGGERRSVTVNPQAGVIVVRAMPSELRAVDDYLSAMQGMVQRQVILEARILEVELSDSFQAGINWAALGKSGNTNINAGQFGSGNVFENGTSGLNGANLFNGGSGLSGEVASGFGGVFALAVQSSDFVGFIELLKSQGDVQVLSSPRVSTVNNQKAVIKVGSDEFFVTGVDSTTTTTATGATGQPQVNVELTPFFSGVALDVTPQISREGDIVLHVHPSVSEVTEQTKSITAMSQSFTLPTAASSIRESDSVVRAGNGQIVVIGGLMQTRTQDQDASVPWLSEVPILGNLFKHTKKVKRKSELVILLKPVVVDSSDAWGQQIEQSSPMIRKLGRQQ